MENKQEASVKMADLRWPNIKDSIQVGIGTLLIMSILMLILVFYKEGKSNPWLVIIPQEGNYFAPEYITSIFTSPFFHADLDHLWPNLLGLWGCGIIAFAVAGYHRTLTAIVLGSVLAGLMLLISGENGGHYFGSMPIIFAFVGVIIQAATRMGIIFILCTMILIAFAEETILKNLQDALRNVSVNKLWLANFFGFVGGLMADWKNPTEAVRILHKRKLISDRQTEQLLRKCQPELYKEIEKAGTQTVQKPSIPDNKINFKKDKTETYLEFAQRLVNSIWAKINSFFKK